MMPTVAALAAFEDVLRGLPDWIAWRLETWTLPAEDRQRLATPVFDAWWWR